MEEKYWYSLRGETTYRFNGEFRVKDLNGQIFKFNTATDTKVYDIYDEFYCDKAIRSKWVEPKLYEQFIAKAENAMRKQRIEEFKVQIKGETITVKNGKNTYSSCTQNEPFDEEKGLAITLLKALGIHYTDLKNLLKKAKRYNNDK